MRRLPSCCLLSASSAHTAVSPAHAACYGCRLLLLLCRSAYTQSPARIDRREGGSYSLFDGSITGEFLSLTPPSCIKQTFRFKEWRDTDLSDVTITLSAPDRSTCRLQLVQTGVPEHDRFGNRDVHSKVEEGWRQFFFLRIQHMLGYSKQHV